MGNWHDLILDTIIKTRLNSLFTSVGCLAEPKTLNDPKFDLVTPRTLNFTKFELNGLENPENYLRDSHLIKTHKLIPCFQTYTQKSKQQL